MEEVQAASAALDDSAKAQAVWAQLRSSQATSISPSLDPSSAGQLSTLERMRAQERLLVEQTAGGGGYRTPVERAKAAPMHESGWRRTKDGKRAFITASGKRLTGKVAHAAAKRLKS